jgi:NAD(P)-dependent dehydrogenase (short-subunit alcohol dehydrogenase family)
MGFEHARLLAARGATVVVNDIARLGPEEQSISAAEAATARITEDGGIALADEHDVSDPDQVDDLITSVLSTTGRLDILVANAGVHQQKPFADEKPEEVSWLVAVNTFGVYHLCHRSWSHVGRRGMGRMVLTASNAGLFGALNQVAYGMSKGAVIGLVRGLALQAPAAGLAINGICPIATTRLTADRPAFAGVRERFAPHHVSPVVAYMAHRDCTLNGAVLTAAGGQVSRIVLARTAGICSAALDIEEVAERLGEIVASHDLYEPASSNDEFACIKQQVGADADPRE